MKKITIIGLICLIAAYTQAQELKSTDVPIIVRQAFASKFPKAVKVEWSKESETEFEAEYKMNGMEMSSNFDQTGKWLVTETEIKSSQFPAAIQAALKKDFMDYKIEESEKAETSGNEVFYEVALEKGKSNLEIKFATDGKIISKEEKKEDKD